MTKLCSKEEHLVKLYISGKFVTSPMATAIYRTELGETSASEG